ncbi:MAG TPA: hypothetical protein VGV90_08855, partial [Solirubrobacteraceae bacterium]|nr:hypothetical protein [Solirubrobacteraceae bacterium]
MAPPALAGRSAHRPRWRPPRWSGRNNRRPRWRPQRPPRASGTIHAMSERLRAIVDELDIQPDDHVLEI